MHFLKKTPARILTGILLLQALTFYGLSRQEDPLEHRPLSELPARIADWHLIREGTIEKEILEVLKADDVLTRIYASPDSPAPANLYIAFFKSQRTGAAPHSPKNCIPGSGWLPVASEIVPIPVSGRPAPISVNRYVITKGDMRNVVLYWYQSRDRVVASEYTARFFLLADAIRYNRTDTTLVRVMVPVTDGNEDIAMEAASAFAHDSFQYISGLLPD